MPDGLLATAPSLKIEKRKVSNVDGVTAEEAAQGLEARKLQLERDTQLLERTLRRVTALRERQSVCVQKFVR